MLSSKNKIGKVFKRIGESRGIKLPVSGSYNYSTENPKSVLRKQYENKLPRLLFLAENNPESEEYKQLHQECAEIFREFHNLD